MSDLRASPSEVIGFDEFDGFLRVRLRTGTIPVVDESGQPVTVSDPSIRERLFSAANGSDPAKREELWNPWRQGP
jgi:hypothetical protein